MHTVLTTNTGRSKRNRFSCDSISADGLDSTYKWNNDKYSKCGEQRESLTAAFLPSRLFMLAYNFLSPEFFFYITCFNQD